MVKVDNSPIDFFTKNNIENIFAILLLFFMNIKKTIQLLLTQTFYYFILQLHLTKMHIV